MLPSLASLSLHNAVSTAADQEGKLSEDARGEIVSMQELESIKNQAYLSAPGMIQLKKLNFNNLVAWLLYVEVPVGKEPTHAGQRRMLVQTPGLNHSLEHGVWHVLSTSACFGEQVRSHGYREISSTRC